MFKLSTKSLAKLKGVHPDLVKVVKRAIELTPIDFSITCGVRTIEEQKVLVATGKSQTMNSRHLPGADGLGYAVDFAAWPDGKVSWELKYYREIAKAFKAAAKELKIPIVWGGDWKSFIDGPHIELDRTVYSGRRK